MLAGPSAERDVALSDARRRPADGTSAFTFTMFQTPGLPDELFEAQYRSLLAEFRNVEREFGTPERDTTH